MDVLQLNARLRAEHLDFLPKIERQAFHCAECVGIRLALGPSSGGKLNLKKAIALLSQDSFEQVRSTARDGSSQKWLSKARRSLLSVERTGNATPELAMPFKFMARKQVGLIARADGEARG